MLFSVLIPVFNEKENLSGLYSRLKDSLKEFELEYELLFVDDGSTDGSLSIIKELRRQDPAVKFLSFSRNFGHQVALSAALEHCLGQAAIIIDADLQDPPELIPELIKKWQEGYHVVGARRRLRKGESAFKTITARWFYRLMQKLTTIDIPLDTGDFRLIDKDVIEILNQMPEPNKFLRGQIAWAGLNQTFIEYDRDERAGGKSGYSTRQMIRFALDGITAFSNAPLKIVSLFGLIASVFAFLMIIYALISNFILQQTVRGWTSLMIAILFIGGIQMIAIGIMGEYLSRINDSVRERPLYIIAEAEL